MSKLKQKPIEVYAHWAGLSAPSLMGVLYTTPSRGKEIFSFEYNENWLANNKDHNIDPALNFFSGTQYPSQGQENFSVFLGSAPDRWGRLLMDRREAQAARKENREERKLLESDYLLGVYDVIRIGALRFRINPNGPFLDNNEFFACPPLTLLRELEHASLELEKNDPESDPNYQKHLQLLIAPGSSLGGARPKASVIDENKHLWIAKFPSSQDSYDKGAWEMVVHKLAKKSGIIVSEAVSEKFNGPHHTFRNKRFDRTDSGERIHMASAMTLLHRRDGEENISYLDIAKFILQSGAQPSEDLTQLWKRIVFFICISNVDDHLRNHAFLLQPKGWVLSPAYDMNPDFNGNGLTLNISESDNAQDLSLALSIAKHFRLNQKNANKIIQEIVGTVKTWRKEAILNGIGKDEQNRMARAFRIVN